MEFVVGGPLAAYYRLLGSKKGRVVIDLDGSDSATRDHQLDLPGEWSVSGTPACSGAGVDLHVVVIDHHDSFTYNLVQALSGQGARVSVRLAESLSLGQLEQMAPDRLLLSPGPGRPEQAVFAQQALERYRGEIPVLGVCLGHQVIATSLGGQVVATGAPAHGKAEPIHHSNEGIFAGVPNPFEAARYHSLAVSRENLPDELQIVAWSDSGMVMAVAVPGEATWGVQFHPESFLTPDGDLILSSFISGIRCGQDRGEPLTERMDSGAF
ncbi:MAG: aminodeoxychorismate/anthranilate synthase component II [Planctomycetota bacterium]|nr:aminodeoxychorismate/anthranilate synthase component II [Planctomycetota bacterium]